jgi:hypothetical protein
MLARGALAALDEASQHVEHLVGCEVHRRRLGYRWPCLRDMDLEDPMCIDMAATTLRFQMIDIGVQQLLQRAYGLLGLFGLLVQESFSLLGFDLLQTAVSARPTCTSARALHFSSAAAMP